MRQCRCVVLIVVFGRAMPVTGNSLPDESKVGTMAGFDGEKSDSAVLARVEAALEAGLRARLAFRKLAAVSLGSGFFFFFVLLLETFDGAGNPGGRAGLDRVETPDQATLRAARLPPACPPRTLEITTKWLRKRNAGARQRVCTSRKGNG